MPRDNRGAEISDAAKNLLSEAGTDPQTNAGNAEGNPGTDAGTAAQPNSDQQQFPQGSPWPESDGSNASLAPAQKQDAARFGVKEESTESLQQLKTAVDAELQQRQTMPANVSTEDADAALEKELVAQFGEGYIKAQNGDRNTYFSKVAWNNLPTKEDGTKDGWAEVVKVPDEVKALNK